MPTFSSIGIHPLLRQRLVTESIHAEDHQFVTTPQALLSRNPGQLRLLHEDGRSSRPIATPLVLKLRYEVATALISQTKTGDRCQRVRNHNTCTRDEGDSERRHDPWPSATTTKQPKLTIPGTVTIWELLRCRHTAVTATNGKMRTPVLRTGCHQLDELVALPAPYRKVSTGMNSLPCCSAPATGIPFGYVIQVAGPPATGKTQLALQLATAEDLHQTWYVCSSTPQVQRLWELGHHDNAILQRTVFRTATNDYQVLQRLAELEVYLIEQHRHDYFDWKPVLLVLDSCSGCLSPPTENEGDSLLMTVAATIRQLTRHYNLATVLINGTVSNRDTTVAIQRPHKAALGHRWNNSVADIALWFEPSSISSSSAGISSVRAKLERHTMKCCTDEEIATFCITAQGIQDTP